MLFAKSLLKHYNKVKCWQWVAFDCRILQKFSFSIETFLLADRQAGRHKKHIVIPTDYAPQVPLFRIPRAMRNPRSAGNHNSLLPPGVYLLEQNFAAYAESGTQHTERQTLAMIFPQETVQGAAIIPRWQSLFYSATADIFVPITTV